MNVGVDNGWGSGYGGFKHPIAAGVAVGAVAGATAAAIRIDLLWPAERVLARRLPGSYYNCGGVAMYRRNIEGGDVTYVVVEKPG